MKGKIYWVVLLLTLLSSCHTASYHFDKFQKKGGKINCVTDTLKVVDTLIINGDTILVPTEKYIVRDSIHYVTKWETKYKYKTIKVQEKTSQIESKEETEQKKEEEKTKRNESDNQRKEAKGWAWWKWMLLGASIGAVIALLLRTIIKQYTRI